MKEPFEAAMPDQEHYSLRWNNHQSHILRAFDTLLQTKTLVDVTLVCAETSIRAHKVVLSACSPFFQRVFSETPCKHPVIVLKDFRGWVVQAIVDFMYRGEISVPQERLSVLIQAGESLQVRGLVDHPAPAAPNTPTPAHSPEDFSLLDASPPLTSPAGPQTPASGPGATSKLLLPPQVFADPSLSLPTPSAADLCTSPMPRRKQARPRRRSGECAPQDLSSKPSTPVPAPPSVSTTDEGLKDERGPPAPLRDDELGDLDLDLDDDDIDELEEEEEEDEDDELELDEDHLKRILRRSQSVDEKLAKEQEQDEEAVGLPQLRVESRGSGDSGEVTRRSRSLQKPRKGGGSKVGDARDGPPLTPSSSSGSFAVSDGPENLCMKKSSPLGAAREAGVGGASDGRGSLGESLVSPATKDPTASGGLLSLKDIRHLNRAALNRSLGSLSPPPSFASALNNNLHPALSLMHHHHHHSHHQQHHGGEGKRVKLEDRDEVERSLLAGHDDMEPPHFLDHMDLALGTHQHPLAHHAHSAHLAAAAAAAAAAAHQHLHAGRSSPQLQGGAEGSENNNSTSKKNHNNNSGGGGNNHGNFLNHHHHQHQQQHHHPQNTPGPPGGNNSSNTGSNTGSSNNNNNNSLHHPHQHPHHGPKSGSSAGPKDFLHSPTLNFPPFFNHSAEGPGPRPPHSPLPFPHLPSVSSLTLTPPHMFGLDSPLGLFPPGMDPGKIYSPLMEMSDPRSMHHDGPPFLKKKMNRPKGQHSAPRGGPPRSWTNAELTEALQHVWNKKMTTSQASRIFGIPYNSLLMYVRGKYGKSLKLEQLRKDCISGPPIELLQMGVGNSSGKDKKDSNKDQGGDLHHHGGGPGREGSNGSGPNGGGGGGGGGGASDLRGPRSVSSEPDLLSSPNPLFNPFPGGFYPDFPGGFPGLPLSMLNLLPPDRHPPHSLPSLAVDEDCKSDRSKQSLDDDFPQPLALNRPTADQLADSRREIYQQNGQD
ncbi:protein jim lovell [Anopheles cruzii]|uniref:protein jim lovell n=1 Tax=Anopheles cruzii TaxID=68878 RepID=UPI0022EC6C71|nr:protein jim lovell [Anopheles cruzii]